MGKRQSRLPCQLDCNLCSFRMKWGGGGGQRGWAGFVLRIFENLLSMSNNITLMMIYSNRFLVLRVCLSLTIHGLILFILFFDNGSRRSHTTRSRFNQEPLSPLLNASTCS